MFKNFSAFILLCCFVTVAWGCANFKEGVRKISGVSTKDLEDSRKDSVTKAFNLGHDACYDKVEGILKKIGAYVYAKDARKTMIAIYVSEQDTTPVGIFFKDIDANNTGVEVSSPSSAARETISQKIFTLMEEAPVTLAPKLQERAPEPAPENLKAE